MKKVIGKSFSKREVEVRHVEGNEFHLQQIDWDDVFTPATINRHIQAAILVLESEGIDLQRLLNNSPHGSAVRDYVLNHLDMEPDSRVGLAARILENCLHINAYERMDGGSKVIPGYALRLGRLVYLNNTYEIKSAAASKSAKNPRPNRRDPLKIKIVQAFRDCRRNDMSLKQAMASLCQNGYDTLIFKDCGESYLISDDDINSTLPEGSYGWASLEAMYTQAKM